MKKMEKIPSSQSLKIYGFVW